MFKNAAAFNQDISQWDINKVYGMTEMFNGATSFSTINYDLFLASSAGNASIASDIEITFSSYYDDANSRNTLTGSKNWTITDLGHKPTADNLSVTADENSEDALTFSLSGSDVDSATLTYSIVDYPKGQIEVTGNSVNYRSGSESNSSDSFKFKVNNGTNDSDTATVSISINNINDVPTTSNTSASLIKDSTTSISLIGHDIDNSSSLTYTITQPTNGTASLSGSKVTYTPNSGYAGSDSFTYTVSDGIAPSNQSTVTITVFDSYLTTPIQIGSTINGTIAGDAFGSSIAMSQNGNVIAVGGDGSKSTNNSTGYIKIYELSNGDWVQKGSTISGDEQSEYFADWKIGINADGTRISAGAPDNSTQAGVIRNYEFVAGTWVLLGSEIEQKNLETNSDFGWGLSMNAAGNTIISQAYLEHNESGLEDTGAIFTYSYDSELQRWTQFGDEIYGEFKDDEFGYSSIISADGKIIAASSVNHIVNDDNVGYVRVFKIENNIWEPLGGDIESDLDLSEGFGSWISLSGDGHTISIGDEDFDNPDGTLDVGAVKVFRYNTVTNVWDLLGTFYGYVENSNLYKSSLSDDGNTIIIGNNQNGELADTVKGYVEAYNYNGSSWDQIGSTIYGEAIGDEFGNFVDLSKDGRIMGITAPKNNNGATDAGAVYMYRLTNNNPVGADQSVTVNEQEDITITLAGEDLDGDSLTYSIVSSAKGSVTLTGNSIIYNSLSDHWNSDTFTYKINDGTADSPTYTVSITITPINDAPTTSSISRATLFNNDTTINLVGSDFDFSDDLTFSIESNPKHGTATLNGNTVTYSPNTNYVGVDSFTYKTSDGTLDSNISTVTLSIYSKYLDTPTLINDKIKHGTAEVFSDFADIIAVNEDASRIVVAQETEYVEVYENKNNTWVQLGQTINDGNVNISSYNGIGINDKGNRIVIGYYDENSGDGLSKVYELNSGQWFQLGTEIKPPLVGDGGNAGYSVRISGDGNTVVMSNEFGHDSKGSFIVYNYNAMSGVDDGTWVQLGSEIIGEESSRLSTSVDISDDGTIVSVTNYDLTDPYVKVFKFNNSNKDWELLGDTIRPQSSDENPSADYAELSSDGYRLSYSCLDCGSSNNGWIEVYEYNTESQSWMILGSPIIGLANSKSGERSTISGDGNTVSSSTDQYDNDNSYVDIYKFNGTDWVSTSKVYLPTLQGAARSILSQDGTKITFSIDQDVEEGAFNKGSVSVYDLVSRFKPSTPNISASTIKNITEEIFLSGTDLDFDTLTGEIVSNPTNGTVSLLGKYATYAPNQGFTGQDTFTYKFNDGVLDSNISTVTITVFDAFVNTARQVGNTIKSLESDPNIHMVTTNKDGSIIAVSSEGGFVRVYKNIEGTWTQLGSAISEEYSSSDLGDWKLSMNNDGTRISIGDYTNEFVNVYDFIDDSWVQVGNKIESFDSGDDFGYPPSLSGDGSVLLSSGYESDINGDNSGAVYAYKFDGVNWVQLGQTIYGEESDYIGYDAQINNDGTIIAMASYDNSYVKVFEYNSETQLWEQLGSNIVGEIEYIDISNDGKTILIVEPSNTDSGAAHIFKYDNDTSDWVAKGSTIYGVPDVKFYYASIDGSGNTVSLASENSYDLGDKTNIGLIRNYTFDTDSSDWTQIGGDVVGEFSGDEIETAVLSSDGLIFITSSSDGYTDSTKPEENFGYVKVFSLQNFIPVADAQTVTAVEQTAKKITLTGSDPDGDELITYAIVNPPSNGKVVIDGKSATYVSTSDTATSDSFTFKVNDGELDSETSTVTIEITAVNDVPTVDNQTVTVTENIAKEITLIGSDPDEDTLIYSIVDQPTDGTVTIEGTTAIYTSISDTPSNDSFTFKANDSEVDSNIATVTINIIPVDDAPIGNEQTVKAVEQVEKSITLTASDPESDTITLYAFKTTPSNGTATINNNVVTYTSNSDTATSDSFTFIVQANGLESIPTTVIINITGTNDAPVAENQTVNVTDKVTETITLLASDPENDALTYTIVDDPVYGTLTINGNKAKYTSNSESETTDSFTFKVDDGNLDSSTAIVSITTTLVNDAPTADNQTVEVNEQTTKEITLNAVDLEGSALTYSIVDKPKSGTVTLDGVIATYISNSNSATSDSFTFKVNDGELDSNTAIISINISNLDDSPTAINQTVEVDEQVAKEIKLVGNDPDGDAITYSIVDQPTDGTVTLDGATATYTSNSDTATSDSFTFKVNDGVTDSNIATISLNITAVNDAPNGNDQTINAVEQVEVIFTLTGSDPEQDDITYAIVNPPSNGKVVIDGTSATYVSTSDTAIDDLFTFVVNDGNLDSERSSITIVIEPVNDEPTVANQTESVTEKVQSIFKLNGSDPEGQPITFTIISQPINGTISLNGREVTYTSSSETATTDSFTYKINDGELDSKTATVDIDILSNDLDNDGILNVDDKCPETPKGSRVDFNGCPIFSLPLDNNKVSIISASCIGNSDGSIGLSVEDASFNYTVTVTGQDDPITLGGEIKTASVTGLGTGTYTVCFKVDGQETYEQCFEVSIAEPKALSAFIDVDNDNKTTSIQLSGSSTYNVEVNGDRFEVKGDRFTTNLPSGLSIIKISTDLDCQGIIEREVFISEDIHYYPNPTEKDVNVHVSGEDTLVQVSVFSEKGDLIYSKEQQIQDFSRKTNIDLSRQITGTYIVVMDGPTVRKTFKIVKR
ncbi:Ig-like domain-containing protein [Flavobacteriaceae bacterium]|nr:Ig-like domain-containing protein [Flavobacteriaceae bacterium]